VGRPTVSIGMADTTPRVALVPGSTRRGSIHRRLALVMADGLRARGNEVDLVDLLEHPMPMYDGDHESEHGPPAAAVALHDRIARSDGLILLSPEHNGGPSALLKNAIDWVTRVDRATLRLPLVGFASASPGSRGAAHVLRVMRSIGEHMRLALAEGDFSLPLAGEAFEPDGDAWTLRADDRVRLDAWLDGFQAQLLDRRAALAAGEGGTGR